MSGYTNPLFLPALDNPQENANVGDPFILRFDGRYYLYPSPHSRRGVEVWVSDDMIHWEHGGLCVEGEYYRGAYAPEVIYADGWFLMVTSLRGEGHVLLRSASPTGPFELMKDMFGHVIDGDFFRDDDGQMYLLHADYPYIHGHTLSPEGELGPEVHIPGATMNHWTEGPMIIKRDGVYYMTMTGNHLISRGYRVDYCISREGPLGPYTLPEKPTLLVDTSREHGSLGHSSSVLGPDLDSWWICYHNFLIDARGRHVGRHANIDRLAFNHEKMLVVGPTHRENALPKPPRHSQRLDLSLAENESWQSDYTLGSTGTAEVTLTLNGAKVAIGGGEFAFDAEGFTARGARHAYPMHLNPDARHTLRMMQYRGRMTLWLDNMQVFEGAWPCVAAPIALTGAKDIGFVGADDHAHQRSDFEAVWHAPCTVDAAMFLPCKGAHEAVLCGFRPEDGMRLIPGADGGQDLLLGAGESVSYRVDVAEAGDMLLQLVFARPFEGKMQITDGETVLTAEVHLDKPGLCRLGKLPMAVGEHTLTVTCETGEAALSALHLSAAQSAEALSLSGLQLCNNVRQIEGGPGESGFIRRFEGLQMDRPIQSLALVGQRSDTDGEIEARFIFHGERMEKGAGVFFRISQDSYYPDQVEVGHRGYCFLIGGGTARLVRMDFNAVTLAEVPFDTGVDVPYAVKVAFDQSEMVCSVNGEVLLTHWDANPWPTGLVGVGTFGARITCGEMHYTRKPV